MKKTYKETMKDSVLWVWEKYVIIVNILAFTLGVWYILVIISVLSINLGRPPIPNWYMNISLIIVGVWSCIYNINYIKYEKSEVIRKDI